MGNFKKALSLGTLRKVKSHDHTIVSRSAMEKTNSKRVFRIPKQTNWLSDTKQVIWEILQMHTKGRVNRHRWDLLLFVTIYNLKKRTDLYYSPRIDWEKTWFNSVQRSAGWQWSIQRSLIRVKGPFMLFLTIDFRIHWRHIPPSYKSSTWTVELQKLCRPCRTKWIWEMLGQWYHVIWTT